MQKIKFEAYLAEFPFIRELIRETFPEAKKQELVVKEIKVRRADENLLLRIPSSSKHVGSLGSSEDWTSVHFILQKGEIIRNAVFGAEEYRSNYAHDSEYSQEGERIIDALSRLENPEQALYIVLEDYYYRGWSGQEKEEYYGFSIYKPPKGVKYSDLIAKAKTQALAEVRAEADF